MKMRTCAWSVGVGGVALALAMIVSACTTTPVIKSTTDDSFDVRAFSTFAFLPEPDVTAEPPGTDLALRLREVVTRELRAKGYRAAPSSDADFVISLYTNLARPLETAARGYFATRWEQAHLRTGPPSLSAAPGTVERGYVHDPERYVHMVVVIDAVDARRDELLWRGWAREKRPPAALSLEELTAAATVVLDQFPER